MARSGLLANAVNPAKTVKYEVRSNILPKLGSECEDVNIDREFYRRTYKNKTALKVLGVRARSSVSIPPEPKL